MEIRVVRKKALTIGDLKVSDVYEYADKSDSGVYMLIGGDCLKKQEASRYCVNLATGIVEEPGKACGVSLVHIPPIEGSAD